MAPSDSQKEMRRGYGAKVMIKPTLRLTGAKIILRICQKQINHRKKYGKDHFFQEMDDSTAIPGRIRGISCLKIN